MSRKLFSVILLAGMALNAQTIELKGVVSNASGAPVSGAIVTLVRQKLKDTTDANGKYSFVSTSVRKLPEIVPQINDISLDNGILQFSLNSKLPMKVETFDLRGNLLRQEINMSAAAGKYKFDISKSCLASKVLVIRAAIGETEVSFKYMPLNGGRHAFSLLRVISAASANSGLTKAAAAVDTITVSAAGYRTKSLSSLH